MHAAQDPVRGSPRRHGAAPRLRARRSLLEVGTGFHPELTGRENIFLNGAVLGMDAPRSSSSLTRSSTSPRSSSSSTRPSSATRAACTSASAFAVAAHLEPEILVVDEVLAVGDAEFQTPVPRQDGRGRQKRDEPSSSSATSCRWSVLLLDGCIPHGQGRRVIETGPTREVIDRYHPGPARAQPTRGRTGTEDDRPGRRASQPAWRHG